MDIVKFESGKMHMWLKEFESWKVYQASSLGDFNKKQKKRGNHPFIYLSLYENNPYLSYGIMLTTKNKDHSILTFNNLLGNKMEQYILLDNIGFINNDDIIGVWNYKTKKKSHSVATIPQSFRYKIIKECNLNVSVETKKFTNFSLNSFETINFEFTENLLIKAFKNRKYEPKLLFNLLLNEEIQKLNHEIQELKNEIEKLKHSNSKTRNNG